jgi:hypothetical protein
MHKRKTKCNGSAANDELDGSAGMRAHVMVKPRAKREFCGTRRGLGGGEGGIHECSPKPLLRELWLQKWWFFGPMPAP